MIFPLAIVFQEMKKRGWFNLWDSVKILIDLEFYNEKEFLENKNRHLDLSELSLLVKIQVYLGFQIVSWSQHMQLSFQVA